MLKKLKVKFNAFKIGIKKSFAGQVMLLASAALGLGLAALIITFTAKVTNDLGASCTNATAALGESGYCGYAIYQNGTQGLGNLASNLGTVGTVIGIAVIILILLAAFGGFLRGKTRV